ncbi:MAG TPA: c-type cytochrome biogenesis protein CcmI [Alphaproteobacteria bacterium]|jgi:cytochrome c-type biogenesis protein CcmH
MTFWLLGGALTLIVLALLIGPLLRPGAGAARRLDYDLEVYKDQLAELERDAARGLIGLAEAAAARLEIQRRILAAANDTPATPAARPRPALALILALALGLPFAGGALYLGLGHPGLPSQSAVRDAPPSDPALARKMAELEAKARQNPTSLEDRLALADFHFENRRFHSAADSYRIALALAKGRGDIAALYGEALTRGAGGIVTEPARKAFEQALAAEPKDPRARFFMGLAESQAGNARAALERWLRLEADSPAGASWLRTLRQEMQRVAREAAIDIAALRRELNIGGAPKGPTARDIEEAEKLSPEERMRMIRGMVANLEARLKDNPKDLEGWKRLGRARSVLNEHAKAAEAYRHAHELAPDDAQVMGDYAAALIRAQTQGKEMTPEAVAVLRKLLAKDANNALALFYLGLAEAEAGNKAEAAAHWKKLLERLPPDAPIRELIQKRLAALGVEEKK